MKRSFYSLSLLALALAAGCAKHGAKDVHAGASGPALRLESSTLSMQAVSAFSEVSGTVRPVERAQLASKVMGVIADLPITLGQRVHKGDLLVSLNAAEISARLSQARSQLNLAQRDLERERELLSKNASTAEMVRSLEDHYAINQALVREAEAMLDYTRIRAPFEGVISRRLANAGDLATPGMPLLEVEGIDRFEIDAQVPESLALSLKVGTQAEVDIAAAALRFQARIAEISPSSDALSRNVLVKLEVPSGVQVRSGQYARIQLPSGQSRLLLCPVSALSPFGQMERVFVVKEGRAVLRLVKTGARRGELVEILSGLSEGEQVLTSIPAGLREGQAVEVKL